MSSKQTTSVNFADSNDIKDAPVDMLLDKNNLRYEFPKALSVIKQRRLIRHHSTLTEYSPENTITITFNNSDDLILGKTSVLYFSIYTDQNAHFGKGSALNLFDEVSLIHRSGVEIDRLIRKNVYSRNKIPWSTTKEWRKRNGDLMFLEKNDEATARTEVKAFYDEAEDASAAAQLTAYKALAKTSRAASAIFALAGAEAVVAGASAANVRDAVRAYIETHNFDFDNYNGNYEALSTTSGTPTRIGIPLSMISGLFATDKMIPHFLLSGLKLNLKLSSAAVALISSAVGTPVTTYTISDVYVAADSFILHDEMIEELTSKSASGDLSFHFPTYGHVPKTIQSTALHITSEQAVAVSNMCFMVARQTDTINSAGYDSLGGEGVSSVASFQYRLGSQYFPPNTLSEPKEMYHWTLSAMGQLGKASVSYTDYLGTDMKSATGFGEWTQSVGNGILPVNLERNSMGLNLSGVPVSGIQSIVLNTTFQGDATDRTIDLFTEYTRVIIPYLYGKLVVRE